MTKSKNTKRALIISVLSMMLCIAMLVGSTFAWFTDSVTSGKNIIKAGNLNISATVHELSAWSEDALSSEDGLSVYSYTSDFMKKGGEKIVLGFSDAGVDFEDNAAFMSHSLFEPGKTYVKMIRVKNDGNLAAKIKLHFDVNDGGLQGALWFAISATDGKNEISLNRQPMAGLNNALKAVSDLVLMPNGKTEAPYGDTVEIVFAYGMNEEAQNEYQQKSFEATMSIFATQYTYEKDSFSIDYDAKARYTRVVSAINSAIDKGAADSNLAITEALGKENLIYFDDALTVEPDGVKSITLHITQEGMASDDNLTTAVKAVVALVENAVAKQVNDISTVEIGYGYSIENQIKNINGTTVPPQNWVAYDLWNVIRKINADDPEGAIGEILMNGIDVKIEDMYGGSQIYRMYFDMESPANP